LGQNGGRSGGDGRVDGAGVGGDAVDYAAELRLCFGSCEGEAEEGSEEDGLELHFGGLFVWNW